MNEEDFRVVEAKIIALDIARTILAASKRISFFQIQINQKLRRKINNGFKKFIHKKVQV